MQTAKWLVIAGGILVSLIIISLLIQKLTPPSKLPSQLKSPTTINVDEVPADWQTYQNTQYSYKISFPKSWLAKNYAADNGGPARDNSNMVELSDPKLIKYDRETGANSGFIFLQTLQSPSTNSNAANVSQLTINNIPATVEQQTNGNKTYLFALSAGNYIEMLVNYPADKPENKQLFDQIVSTFHTLPSVSQPQSAALALPNSWKTELMPFTHQDEMHGKVAYVLSIAYPPSWSFQKITAPHAQDNLSTGCANYTFLTNQQTETYLVIEPICKSWNATYQPFPTDYELVRTKDVTGTTPSTRHLLRVFGGEGNTYFYVEANTNPGEPLTSKPVVSPALLVFSSSDDFFLPVRAWISAASGTTISPADIQTADTVITNLSLRQQ